MTYSADLALDADNLPELFEYPARFAVLGRSNGTAQIRVFHQDSAALDSVVSDAKALGATDASHSSKADARMVKSDTIKDSTDSSEIGTAYNA